MFSRARQFITGRDSDFSLIWVRRVSFGRMRRAITGDLECDEQCDEKDDYPTDKACSHLALPVMSALGADAFLHLCIGIYFMGTGKNAVKESADERSPVREPTMGSSEVRHGRLQKRDLTEASRIPIWASTPGISTRRSAVPGAPPDSIIPKRVPYSHTRCFSGLFAQRHLIGADLYLRSAQQRQKENTEDEQHSDA
jgi:hypothetical protein